MRTLLLVALLALAGCGSAPKGDVGKRYRAWCVTESKPVGPWRDSRDEALADSQAHTRGGSYYHTMRINVGKAG